MVDPDEGRLSVARHRSRQERSRLPRFPRQHPANGNSDRLTGQSSMTPRSANSARAAVCRNRSAITLAMAIAPGDAPKGQQPRVRQSAANAGRRANSTSIASRTQRNSTNTGIETVARFVSNLLQATPFIAIIYSRGTATTATAPQPTLVKLWIDPPFELAGGDEPNGQSQPQQQTEERYDPPNHLAVRPTAFPILPLQIACPQSRKVLAAAASLPGYRVASPSELR